MSGFRKISDSEYEFVLYHLKEQNYESAHQVWANSEVYIEVGSQSFLIPNGTPLNLSILTDPYIFSKDYQNISVHKNTFKKLFQDFTGTPINFVNIHPELEKFSILKNPIKVVITPWDQINKYQELLVEQLKEASSTIQFENIGNTSRKTLKELADAVFNPDKHKAPAGVSLGAEMYKNKLHTFIRSEVGDTNQNKEFLDCIDSIIETAERTVDLSNKIVHDANGYKLMTESCVISVVTVINLIKLIYSNQKKPV